MAVSVTLLSRWRGMLWTDWGASPLKSFTEGVDNEKQLTDIQ